jgi:hypothetical protein
MDNKILNEITSIKKMMGLISEATKFAKFDGGYGIEQNNFDAFISKAKQAKETPFLFGNHIFKLNSYGENNESKDIASGIHNLQWGVSKPIYTSTGGYPHIAVTDTDGGQPTITTRKGSSGFEFSAYPQNANFYSPEFKDAKVAFDNFKDNLNRLTPDSKQDVLNMYGEKLKEKFGEELVNTL